MGSCLYIVLKYSAYIRDHCLRTEGDLRIIACLRNKFPSCVSVKALPPLLVSRRLS